jgi:hypothetical protein
MVGEVRVFLGGENLDCELRGTAGFSETLVVMYESTQCLNPETTIEITHECLF